MEVNRSRDTSSSGNKSMKFEIGSFVSFGGASMCNFLAQPRARTWRNAVKTNKARFDGRVHVCRP